MEGNKVQIFNKRIHENEFKLRFLVTDECNKNCSFCLNDFQDKPFAGKEKYLDFPFVARAVAAYKVLFKDVYPLQVYFSGGEPTLHPKIDEFIYYAHLHKCRTTLCTNGSFSDNLEEKLKPYVDCWHFGVYEKNNAKLAERIKRLNGQVQCVFSNKNQYVNLEFLKFYLSEPYKLPIKIFGDLKEDNQEFYREFAQQVVSIFPKSPLSFRFIGIQENRGIGCANCDRYCVTLKGAWVFPDGGISHCPQKCKGEVYYPSNYYECKAALKMIELLHRK